MDSVNSLASQYLFPTLDNLTSILDSLSFLGVNTHVVKLPQLDDLLAPTAANLGMELTIIKYTLALFLVYPLAYIMKLLPNKHLKHLASFLGGLVLVQWIFGPDWIHSFITSLGTYLICALFPSKYSARVVFIFVMTYMTGSHLYRMYVSYLSGIFDFTGTQMVLTMKLTSFAYNLYDGTYDHKNVFKHHEKKSEAKMYADRKRFAIEKLPSLLEFFGYIYCFTCILAGPAFEYQDYVRAIDETIFQPHKSTHDEKTDNKAVQTSKKPTLPSPFFPAVGKLAIGVVSLVGHVLLSGAVPMSNCYDPTFISTHPPLYRWLYMYMALAGSRLKYYFVWMVAEGSSNLAGFGFEGYDKENNVIGWDGVKNIDILGTETASCVQHLSRAWNKRTQGWLERYTYTRTGRSLMITYFISALWHGLYPGFFVFFMSLPLLTSVERLFRSKINPILAPEYDGFNISTYPKTFIAQAYWYICLIVNTIVINYCLQFFSYGSLERCLRALESYQYLGHIVTVIAYIVLSLLPTPRTKKDEITDKKIK